MRLLSMISAGVVLAIAGAAASEAAPEGLAGAWRVATLDGAPPPGRAGVTLNFEPGGRLHGQAPCNRYHAGYRIEADRIVFSAGALTRMFCGEEIMRTEQRFMEMLSAAIWRVSGDNLTLEADNGARVTAIRARAR